MGLDGSLFFYQWLLKGSHTRRLCRLCKGSFLEQETGISKFIVSSDCSEVGNLLKGKTLYLLGLPFGDTRRATRHELERTSIYADEHIAYSACAASLTKGSRTKVSIPILSGNCKLMKWRARSGWVLSAASLKCKIFCCLAGKGQLPTNEWRFRHYIATASTLVVCWCIADVRLWAHRCTTLPPPSLLIIGVMAMTRPKVSSPPYSLSSKNWLCSPCTLLRGLFYKVFKLA
jgi:hypothetical protein